MVVGAHFERLGLVRVAWVPLAALSQFVCQVPCHPASRSGRLRAEGTAGKTASVEWSQGADSGDGEEKAAQTTAGTVAECCGMYQVAENGWAAMIPDPAGGEDHRGGRLSSIVVAAAE